jgi:hypothetical protein
MELEQLLQHLASSLGHENFELNEHGVLSLRFDDDIVVHLEPDPDEYHCHLYSTLCRVPEDTGTRQRILEALMTANTFGKGTGGAAFGLDEGQNELVLTRTFSLERVQPKDLMPWLQDMVSVMDIWRKRLPELGAAEFPAGGGDDSAEIAYAIRV